LESLFGEDDGGGDGIARRLDTTFVFLAAGIYE
jgi:hypothetical protein